jgi:hypothetical protein
MASMSPAVIRRRYPELSLVFDWPGWTTGSDSPHQRWRYAEVMWALYDGDVVHASNAARALRERLDFMDGEATADMTSQQLSNLYAEMAGMAATTRVWSVEPPMIEREVNVTRTKRIALSAAWKANMPPNPFELRRKNREAVAALRARATATRIEHQPEPEPEPAPVRARLEPPDPGEGASRVKELLGIPPDASVSLSSSAVPVVSAGGHGPRPQEPEAPTPAPTPPPEPTPRDNKWSLFREDVYELPPVTVDVGPVTVGPYPGVAPPVSYVDQLLTVGDRSMVDNARLLMSLAGDLLVQAAAAPTFDVPADASNDLVVVKERLSSALEEGGRLRKRLQAVETQVKMADALARRSEAALVAERERADALEANLTRVLRGEKATNDKALKGVQRFMSEKPRVPVS